MKYNTLFCIGRFQPFHDGHKAVIEKALTLAHNVVVLIGSSNIHRSTRNPWTFLERRSMIQLSFNNENILCHPLNDYTYNDTAWILQVNNIIKKYGTKKVGIIGFDKDASSYYLKMFPGINVELIPTSYGTINATQIREQYFQEVPIISEFLPTNVRTYLKEFAFTEEFKWLLNEYNYVKAYKKSWENTPYPPVFVTVDPIVIQSGNILLVTRGDAPYKGCLALPGGFLNPKEKIKNAVIRELKEETRIADPRGEIPPAMLQSFITKEKTYDDPERSDRGRTITHAFLFELPKREKLYKVRGNDDAADAQWYNLSNLKSADFMEDHAFIIQDMLKINME